MFLQTSVTTWEDLFYSFTHFFILYTYSQANLLDFFHRHISHGELKHEVKGNVFWLGHQRVFIHLEDIIILEEKKNPHIHLSRNAFI